MYQVRDLSQLLRVDMTVFQSGHTAISLETMHKVTTLAGLEFLHQASILLIWQFNLRVLSFLFQALTLSKGLLSLTLAFRFHPPIASLQQLQDFPKEL